MLKVVFFLAVFTLSVVGLCDIVHSLWMALLRPKKSGKNIMLCMLSGEFADLQLQAAQERFNWYGKEYADEIVAVDMTGSPNTSERCRAFAERRQIPVMLPEHVADYIKKTGEFDGQTGEL